MSTRTPRAIVHSSTRARARRTLDHQHASTTNTRALEHEHDEYLSNNTRARRTRRTLEHSSTRALVSARVLEHGHEHENIRARARAREHEHSSTTGNRALEHSSTRARARRTLDHQHSSTTNTRALEHSPTLEDSSTWTSTRTLRHEHEHSNMSTRGGQASTARGATRILHNMRIPSDILLTCTWACVGLDGSACSECFLERTCHFQPPEHVPRTSAGPRFCE